MKLKMIAGVVCVAAFGAMAIVSNSVAQNARPEKHVSAEHAIACINTAISARPGRVKELEIDVKDGKTICEVDVIGANGKKSEVQVDVATNNVVKVKD